MEKELNLLRNIHSESIEPSDQENPNSDNVVLQDSFFQTSSATDSSLYSFLDIGDEENLTPSNKTSMRYYYSDPSMNNHISGILSLPEKENSFFLVKKAIKLIGHEYYLFDSPKFLIEIEENYSTGLKTNNPSWMCYFLLTLAIGQQYLNETLTIEVPGINYYKVGMKIFQGDFEVPTIELIQTLLLIAFYQQGLNRSNTSSCYYGLAIRAALLLGLHRKSKLTNLVEREKRRRLWWTCYIMDSIWAAKLGQPIHVEFDDITVELDPITELNDGFNNEVLKYNSKLAMIIADIMKTIYKPTSIKRVSDLLKSLSQLSNFQQSLPPTLKGLIITPNDRTSANLYLRLNQIVIITIRPLILSIFSGQQNIKNTPEINQATKKCISAACSNISILEELRKTGLFSNFGFWDARYLFSSLLVLYMTGDSYQEIIRLGRKLNKLMAEAGNFTAIENDIRLKELDLLFSKIKVNRDSTNDSDITRVPNHKSTMAVVSPNTLLMDDILTTFSHEIDDFDHNEMMNLFHPLSKELPPDIFTSLTSNLKSWDTFGM